MRLNRITENPIEMIRISHKLNQEEFSRLLGFKNKDQYAYHARRFSSKIIEKIQHQYNENITQEVISYLLAIINKLSVSKNEKMKNKSVSKNNHLDFLNKIN